MPLTTLLEKQGSEQLFLSFHLFRFKPGVDRGRDVKVGIDCLHLHRSEVTFDKIPQKHDVGSCDEWPKRRDQI